MKATLNEGQVSSITKSTNVYIRAYKNTDLQECREIFTQGMEQLISLIARVIFPKYIQLLAALSAFVLPIVALLQWSVTMILLYIFTCVVMFALLYVLIYVECWKFINSCLATDLENIEKSYMSSDGSHMWVAEWNGKVVGMVGLLHKESHKPGVVELNRMHVLSSYRRKGIARKLLERVVSYAREQRYDKILLHTTSAQKAAFGFYKKCGFQLIKVLPFPQKLPTDLQLNYFELEL